MIRYYITDRAQLGSDAALIDNITAQLSAGVDMIQIRERDLCARELHALSERVLNLPNPHGSRILLNDRTDVALAAGVHGVHLRSRSVPPFRVRAIAPADFLIGVSCHSVEDVRQAADEGASFAVLGPISAVAGKSPAVGIQVLAEAARSVTVPVLALGGIRVEHIEACIRAGAAGVAGISLFQERHAIDAERR